jgi:hypothetical protein
MNITITVTVSDVDPVAAEATARRIADAAVAAGGTMTTAVPTPMWTVDMAAALLQSLAEGPVRAIRTALHGNGWVPADLVRGSSGSLKGRITGPITKTMARLVRAGVLPKGLPPPLVAEYDPAVRGYQPTRGFRMTDELLDVFTAAFQQLGH